MGTLKEKMRKNLVYPKLFVLLHQQNLPSLLTMLKSAGRFFIMATKPLYNKTLSSVQDQISLLKQRGLLIEDENKAARQLFDIGYYRLSAYFYPLLQSPKKLHRYKPGATFGKAMDMYRFDRKLRYILFNEIEKLEISIRSCIVNTVTKELGTPFWMTEQRHFANAARFQTSLSAIDAELLHSKEDFIKHYRNSYSNTYPPAWMLGEILPLGTLSHIYNNIRDIHVMKKVAQHYGLQQPVFSSWIVVLYGLRNMCCHHSRTWNRELAVVSASPRKVRLPWIDATRADKRRMYYRISMIKFLLQTVSPKNDLKKKLKSLFAEYPSVDISAMGFPADWESEPLWK